MKRKFLLLPALILTAIPLLLPEPTLAAGLVPCGDTGEAPCQFCHFVSLTDNVLDWLITILTLITTIIFVISGIQLATSVGDVSAKTAAKKRITNAIIGLVIVLAAWLLIDLGLKALLKTDPTNLGPWHAISCVDQPAYTPAKTPTNNLSSPGYRACPESLTPNAPTQRVTVYHGTGTLPNCATILANPTSYTPTTQVPIEWTTSNPRLASVSPEGTITTHSENWSGFDSAIITATYPDGSVAKTLVVGGQAGTPGTAPTPGAGNTCHRGNGISFCEELPLSTKSDDTIAPGGKGVYHFKIDPGDTVQGYTVTAVGFATPDGGKGGHQLYIGISETPGVSRGAPGPCFSGHGEEVVVTFHTSGINSCKIEPGVDYYVTVEDSGTATGSISPAGIRISTNGT